ncbi:MAG: 16S rRNA (adenine(1518)-N(6)/adenine(1519)-N(6))-dimethyltransferase RsmA [Treponema sp.]|jgi:16S rRNA (adenine1518-N6/adenine1519-N6)-dimethyltransferase|nr:16S rRNA (adenine(1518)-N(6)/adenine(1519)-N(6))-dimethyltransferase RsmA [Treponema sp.]
MINYNSASALRTFLEQEGLGMRKKFGQNFLINPAVRHKLVDALGAQGADEVWEIGPGLGAMTAMLLEKGLKVKAFEIDSGFIRILKREFAEEKSFCLVEGDVLKTWKSQTTGGTKAASFLFGNLPYNIAAAFLADLIEKGCLFQRIVVTVQKEVALRMTASAGSPDYSSFSVLCATAYNVKPLTVIRPSSFYPQPNVDSMGVLLENRNAPAPVPVFSPLVRALFSSRRKTIKNNLSVFCASRFGSPALCAGFLQENSLSGMERAEQLTPEVFLSLAKSIQNVRL